MPTQSLEKEIWMMRADLRAAINNLSAARVYLKDIEEELWMVSNEKRSS